MSTKQHRGLQVAGVLFVLALLACAMGVLYLNKEGLLRLQPIPESPDALSSAVPISSHNLLKLEPLFQFKLTYPGRDSTGGEDGVYGGMVWSPDSHWLAIATERNRVPSYIPSDKPSGGGSLHLLNVSDGTGRQVYSETTLPFGANSEVAFSPDGKTLIYRTDNLIRLRDVARDLELNSITSKDQAEAHKKFLALANGRELQTLPNIPDASKVTLSPDSKTAAAGYRELNGYKLELFDAATGKELRPITGSEDIAFSHDGKLIVSRDKNDADENFVVPILVSDVASGQVIRRLEGNVDVDWEALFSPDDSLLAVAQYIWDVKTGTRFTFKTGGDPIRRAAFSPDGRFIAAAIGTGPVVQLWGVKP